MIESTKQTEPKLFSFDYVADEATSQAEVFDVVARPIVDSHIDGYHGCIFAYGQTGSGKSYTIMGPDGGEEDDELRGLIPRTFDYMFAALDARRSEATDAEITHRCTLSFLEIYNENIIDLLDTSNAQSKLSIREDLKKGVYVEGLREIEIESPAAAIELLSIGINNRHVAATAMNSNSSRSHSVLALNLESTIKTSDGLTKSKYSRLSLIDLAGSERQKSTEAAGSRLKEAGSINKSLSVLGNVIRSLVDIANGKPRHVGYRDSKLTFLLKDSLGGNSKTYIIATVSPCELYYNESLSTLQFAQRAKHVRNIAVVNEEASGNVALLQMEIRKLKEELYRAGSARYGAVEQTRGGTHESRIYDLEVNLSQAFDRHEHLEEVVRARDIKINALKLLLGKKDHFLQSTKFVLKLRESAIARITGKDPSAVLFSTYEEELKEEIATLRRMIDLHPQVTKYAIENLELRERIARYEEGKDDYEDQITTYKQQIQELTSETKYLLAEKHQYQLKSGVSGGHTGANSDHWDNDQPSPYKAGETPSTPYLERQRHTADMEKSATKWQNEKATLEAEFQELHERNIRAESDLKATKSLLANTLKQISSQQQSHDAEIERLNQSHEVSLKVYKSANALKDNVPTEGLIGEMVVGLSDLEQENNELKDSRIKLMSELFEAHKDINVLRSERESLNLSSRQMSQVFISTPLCNKSISSALHINNEESENRNEPIRFSLGFESPSDLTDLRDRLDRSLSRIVSLENDIKEKSMQLEIEQLMNDIETIKNQPIDVESVAHNAGVVQSVLKSKEIQLLLSKKDEEVEHLLGQIRQKEGIISNLQKELGGHLNKLAEIESSYQIQLRDTSSRLEVALLGIAKRDEEIAHVKQKAEKTLLKTKATMLEEFEESKERILLSARNEYETNLALINNQVSAIKISKDETALLEKYNQIKQDNDKMMDDIDRYQDTISDQLMEITALNNKVKQLRGTRYEPEEHEIIVISSDEEDYVPPPPAKRPEDVDEDFDYSQIVIKKNPYAEDADETFYDESIMTISDIAIATSNLSLNSTSNDISATNISSQSNKSSSSESAIQSNLSIISQLGRLERSFNAPKSSQYMDDSSSEDDDQLAGLGFGRENKLKLGEDDFDEEELEEDDDEKGETRDNEDDDEEDDDDEDDDEDFYYQIPSDQEDDETLKDRPIFDPSEEILPDDELILLEIEGEDPGILVNAKYSLIGLDSDTPMLQIGTQLFKGKYQDVVVLEVRKVFSLILKKIRKNKHASVVRRLCEANVVLERAMKVISQIKMPVHNKVLSNTHLRKHWQFRVRTWFNQPGRALRRRETRAEKAAAIFPRPLRTLKPIVRPPTQKYNIKTREGRGFTLEELKAAKLSVRYARTIGIAVDTRRDNESQESLSLNAQRLKEYQSKLVLFPRKSSAPKKGDATKAETDAAVQNLNVMPFNNTKVSTFAPRKVTDAEKTFKAYSTLRAAAAKVKTSGMRKKAAEKKAAESKDK
eukprot:gene10727-12486_t